MMYADENDNNTIDSVSHQLGVLSGRFDSIEESIRSISDAMQTIAAHSARVDMLEQARVRHDKRLSALECENAAQQQTLEQVKKHIEKDTPVEVHMGKWAVGVVVFVGGLVVKWIFDNLHKILSLMK